MGYKPLVFIDFETDGLKIGESVPTQLAMIAYNPIDRVEIASHEFFIKPPDGHTLDKSILAKTDVSYEDAMSGLDLETSCQTITDFIRESVGGKMNKFNKPTIVAHNAPFDVSWMMWIFNNQKKDISKVFETQNSVVGYICTQRMFASYVSNPNIKYEGGKSLSAMAGFFDVSLLNAHGAMADSIATLKCWEKMNSSSFEKEVSTTTKNLKKKRNHFQI